ncbi:MAG: hypothetical protein IV090_01535 [Candidatus Sericytochromatia bacterium]|nr:hypothetical protein [Candidatus Sericytochromatia bacterium]
MSSTSSRSPHRTRQTLQMILFSSLAALQMACTVLVNTGLPAKVPADISAIADPDYKQHPLKASERALDWAIDGKGYFQVLDRSNGKHYLTRNGAFQINDKGELVTKEGFFFDPSITFPKESAFWFVSESGSIYAKMLNAEGQDVQLGAFPLSRVPHPEALKAHPDFPGYYETTPDSGRIEQGQAGQNFFGFVVQNVLEDLSAPVSALPQPGCQFPHPEKQSKTEHPMDWAIDGQGLFVFVHRLTGERLFSRKAKILQSPDGQLVSEQGYPLEPQLYLPKGHKVLKVDPDGTVWSGSDPQMPQKLGQLQLAKPEKPESLKAMGFSRGVTYLLPNREESIAVKAYPPGQASLGQIKLGYLESCVPELGFNLAVDSERKLITLSN